MYRTPHTAHRTPHTTRRPHSAPRRSSLHHYGHRYISHTTHRTSHRTPYCTTPYRTEHRNATHYYTMHPTAYGIANTHQTALRTTPHQPHRTTQYHTLHPTTLQINSHKRTSRDVAIFSTTLHRLHNHMNTYQHNIPPCKSTLPTQLHLLLSLHISCMAIYPNPTYAHTSL